MRKEIVSTLISVFLLSAISLVAGGGSIPQYECNDPSTCYQCAYEGCLVYGYPVGAIRIARKNA